MDDVSPKINPSTPNMGAMGMGIPSADYETDLLTWVVSAVKEGEALNASEGEAENVEENIKIALGDVKGCEEFEPAKPFYRSRYTMNRIGKNINDIASAITDFRPIGQFKTYNDLYEGQCSILDKLLTSWWYTMDIDLKIQLLVKQSLVARTAYAQVVFNPSLHNGLGDIDIVIRDYRDVLLVRPNSKLTIQDAVGVVIKSKNTVNWGRTRYPEKASRIQATAEGGLASRWSQRGMVTSPALDHLDRQISKKKTDFAIPTYDHYELYVRDHSINSSGQRQWVGPGPAGENEWGYWVEPNKPLYPRGRLIVVANLNTVLFDGGNPYWHGMFPLIKLTLDEWPMTFLGKSAVQDAKPLHKANNELFQGIVDCARKALKPGIIYTANTLNRQTAEEFDSSLPGYKLRTNTTGGQGIIMEPPPQIPPFVQDLRIEAKQELDHVMGVLDMRALQQLKQLSGDINLESLMEHLGPSIRTKGRILEIFIRELGIMMKSNFFQFYTVPRRIEILGPEGMDFEDFDFDPGTLVPAFTQSDLGKEFSRFYNEDSTPKSRAERGMEHARSFTYFVTPNSLLSIAKTQDKLLYLQLFRMGVIDPITLLEKLEVPNIGELPGGPTSILERMAAAAQQGYVGAVTAAGRKATGEDMPRMVMKESS